MSISPTPAQIRDACLSRDGRRAYVLVDRENATRRELYEWDLHGPPVLHGLSPQINQVRPDGLAAANAGQILTFTSKGQANVWDLDTATEVYRCSSKSSVENLAYLGPDPQSQSELVAAFSADQVLRIFKLGTQPQKDAAREIDFLSIFNSPENQVAGIQKVAFGRDPWHPLLAVKLRDGTGAFARGDTKTGKIELIEKLPVTADQIRAIGTYDSLSVAGTDNGIYILGKGLAELGKSYAVDQLTISPRDDRFAFTSSDGDQQRVIAVDVVENGEGLKFVELEPNQWVTALAFSQTGKRLCLGHAYGAIRLWHVDPARGNAQETKLAKQIISLPDHESDVLSLRFSLNGRNLISCDAAHATVHLSRGWPREVDDPPATASLVPR